MQLGTKHMGAKAKDGSIIKNVTFVLFALAFLAERAKAQPVIVEDIRVQLFYESTGKLSADLAKVKDVSFWNTIIGEGFAKEPANSFLVSVVLRGKPASFVNSERVVVTVFDESKKSKALQRRFRSFLFSDEGLVVKPVFVENQTCAPVRISAQSKANTKTITLPFKCGE
jgi:hypothetical protein